jgi:hypothetical protein
MRCLPRTLPIAAAALSLASSVGVAALWVRSYWRMDVFGPELGSRQVAVASHTGGMSLTWQTLPRRAVGTFRLSFPVYRLTPFRNLYHFDASRAVLGDGTGLTLYFPHWFACAVTAAPGAWSLARRARRRRTEPGRGFDVSPSPATGRPA